MYLPRDSGNWTTFAKFDFYFFFCILFFVFCFLFFVFCFLFFVFCSFFLLKYLYIRRSVSEKDGGSIFFTHLLFWSSTQLSRLMLQQPYVKHSECEICTTIRGLRNRKYYVAFLTRLDTDEIRVGSFLYQE